MPSLSEALLLHLQVVLAQLLLPLLVCFLPLIARDSFRPASGLSDSPTVNRIFWLKHSEMRWMPASVVRKSGVFVRRGEGQPELERELISAGSCGRTTTGKRIQRRMASKPLLQPLVRVPPFQCDKTSGAAGLAGPGSTRGAGRDRSYVLGFSRSRLACGGGVGVPATG